METKTCSSCKQTKPITFYNKYKRSQDGYDYRCKECSKQSNKNWYNNNWDKKMSQQRDRTKLLVEQVRNYKQSFGCNFCDEDEPICLELHHLDPTDKEINPSNMACRGWSWERMQRELSKCIVLCSNCHKKVHAGLLV